MTSSLLKKIVNIHRWIYLQLVNVCNVRLRRTVVCEHTGGLLTSIFLGTVCRICTEFHRPLLCNGAVIARTPLHSFVFSFFFRVNHTMGTETDFSTPKVLDANINTM